jgi:hypothetical protein
MATSTSPRCDESSITLIVGSCAGRGGNTANLRDIRDEPTAGWRRWSTDNLGCSSIGRFWTSPGTDDGSRMTRECHVRFCEGLWVKLPRSTLPLRARKPPAAARCGHCRNSRRSQTASATGRNAELLSSSSRLNRLRFHYLDTTPTAVRQCMRASKWMPPCGSSLAEKARPWRC